MHYRDKEDQLRPWVALALVRIGQPIKCGNFVIDTRQEGLDLLTQLIRRRQFDIADVGDVLSELGGDAVPLVPAEKQVPGDHPFSGRKSRRGYGCWRESAPRATEAVPVLETLSEERGTQSSTDPYCRDPRAPGTAAPRYRRPADPSRPAPRLGKKRGL